MSRFAKNLFVSIKLIPIGLPALAEGPCETLLNDTNVIKAKPDNAIDTVVSLEGKPINQQCPARERENRLFDEYNQASRRLVRCGANPLQALSPSPSARSVPELERNGAGKP